MKINKLKYSAFLLLIIFSACEKDIDIEVKEGTDQMVINAWLQPGLVPEIKIHKSVFIFDRDQITNITDAKAELYSNGELLGELLYSRENEIYSNTEIQIEENSNYELIIEHRKYGKVKSKVQIPERLSAGSVEMKYKNFITLNNSYQNFSGEVQIKISDPSPQKNYYLFRILALEQSYFANSGNDTVNTSNYWTSLETNDEQIKRIYVSGGGDLFLMSDEIFNGGDYTIKLSSYNDLRKEERIDEWSYYKRSHHIQMHQVNEALYKYYVSLENNRYPDVFTEPSPVFTNVENGYGIVAASTLHTKEIEESKD